MAKIFNADNKLSPKELVKHLRRPSGDTGKEVGVQMNKGNKYICLNSYEVLNPNDGDSILEIGMGNGFFVGNLLRKGNGITYKGVDFSAAMIEEAIILNTKFVEQGKVEFHEASIANLPFNDNSFDSITTTNTLYFWPQPEQNIKELLRVLKPEGKLYQFNFIMSH